MSNTCVFAINASVAKSIGLESALVLSQIQYWVDHCGRSIAGEEGKWIYNSLEKWHVQFSFWSLSKLRRIIKLLEDKNLILSTKVNSKKWNQTKWYTINFKTFNTVLESSKKIIKKEVYTLKKIKTNRYVQNEQMLDKETKTNYTKISSYKKDENPKFVFKKNSSPDKQVRNFEITKMNQETIEHMIQIWNSVFEYSLEPIQAFSNKNIAFQLNTILQNKFNNDLENWRGYAKKVNSSKFLMGEKETKNNFKAEFTWLIKDEVVDTILQGAYGVGDRSLDSEMLEANLKSCEKDVKQKLKDKVSKYLEQTVSLEQEEQEFKEYLVKREFKKDGDKYQVQKHMDSIGNDYMYGGYITPSHVFYPGNENYKKRIFNSYLMKKYCGIDETILDSQINSSFKREPNRIALFQTMKNIKNKISNFDVLLDGAKNFQQIVDFRMEARGFCS